jgi:translation elongation factor EF-G
MGSSKPHVDCERSHGWVTIASFLTVGIVPSRYRARVEMTMGGSAADTHPKDSSELAFRTAGRLGLREALRACAMQLLEPVVQVTVTVPDDAVGGVLGDLAARRGHVTGSQVRAGTATVTATVPLAGLFGYATRLRSRTQGRGTFTPRPAGYAPAAPG